MLKYVDYDIVFQEIPDEVTLAINLALCPNRCIGCHSPHLWENIGEPLNETALEKLLNKYGTNITCVCFMGGDNDPFEVAKIAEFIREYKKMGIKTAWYSGREQLPNGFPLKNFHYIKLGPYIPRLGGLKAPNTNQRLFRIRKNETFEDITWRLQKHNVL